MRHRSKPILAALGGAMVSLSGTSQAATLFSDLFATGNSYSSGSSSDVYSVTDESSTSQSTWTAGGGTLVYSRAQAFNDTNYHYASSVLLTNGSTASTGNTFGLAQFTVAGSFKGIPTNNTFQPGLIVTGSLNSGGYLLEDDNGVGNAFALIAETGAQLVSDEGQGNVVMTFGAPTPAQDYSVAVTIDRSGINPAFTVNIYDLTTNSSFYSGSFIDSMHPVDFGGTQIGYRVRDPLDSEMPAFGALSLSAPVPEPAGLAALGVGAMFLRRRRSHS